MRETLFHDPALGWVHNLDPVLLSLGPLQIRYYGAIFAASLFVAFLFWQWQMRRAGRDKKATDAMIAWGVVGTIVGARLGHCLFYEWHVYREEPWRIVKFWEGGLASHGATLGILVALFFYALRYRIPYLEVCDRFTFSAATAAAGVRLGNFLNSEIVGRVTDWPWGVRFVRYDLAAVPPALREAALPTVPGRHPSQLYEFAMGLLVLFALWLADRALGRERRPRGAMLGLFLGLYFLGRFVVEIWKEYQTDLALDEGLTRGQYLSIVPCLFGWGLFLAATLRRRPDPG
ncbi:MAG: prolipoprotein diacylglyceryl transferase, partial [Planctomycetes bacterium]|nr:prolipoprotein diacylglyceryl transferase [Planctomycetota bacterium]